MFRKIINFIKEHVAEIMIGNMIFEFVVILLATILSITNIITINEPYGVRKGKD